MRGSLFSRRFFPLLAGVAASSALALGGCGSSDGSGAEIPPGEADRLLASLNQVEEAASRRECEQAQAAASQLTIEADSVDVEGAVSQQLAEGSEQIKDLVESEVCVQTGTTDQAGALGEGTTSTTSTTTRSRPDTETEPPVQPEPPVEEPEPPAEEPSDDDEQPEPPDDDGDGDDSGAGNVDGGTGAPTGGTGARGETR